MVAKPVQWKSLPNNGAKNFVNTLHGNKASCFNSLINISNNLQIIRFKEQESKKANEALRPGAPKTADDLFGMDGTFRKLTID